MPHQPWRTILADKDASLELRLATAVELARVGDPRIVLGDRIEIPAGTLHHKDSKESAVEAVTVGAFALAAYPVTVGEYAGFIAADGYEDASLWSSEGWSWRLDEDIERPRFWGETEWAAYLVPNHPVVGVSAFEAEAYATFRAARLPTELEWERAARGKDARDYPWGDDWDEHASSHRENGPRRTVPVGIFPRGVSPFGIHDLCGSVWQWTQDERATAGPYGPQRAVRGGAWNNLPWSIGCSGKNAYPPLARFSNLGVRLAFDPQ